jgi:hypothetical protein
MGLRPVYCHDLVVEVRQTDVLSCCALFPHRKPLLTNGIGLTDELMEVRLG